MFASSSKAIAWELLYVLLTILIKMVRFRIAHGDLGLPGVPTNWGILKCDIINSGAATERF